MRGFAVFIVCVIGLMILVGYVQAEDVGGGEDNELHCSLGAVGLGFMLVVLIVGFIQAGWFGPMKSRLFLRFHFLVAVVLALYLTLVFVFGWVRAGGIWIGNAHGYVGILVPVVSWVAVSLSPCLVVKRIGWKRAGLVHGLVGFLLLALIVTQILIGYLILGE